MHERNQVSLLLLYIEKIDILSTYNIDKGTGKCIGVGLCNAVTL